MSDKKMPRIKLVLGAAKDKLIRFSHLNAHVARLNSESGKLEYSVVLMIPKTNTEDVKAIQDAIKQLKQQVWLDDGKKVPPQFWNPLKDGDTDTKQDGSPLPADYQGHYVINAKTDAEHPPTVVGTTRDEAGKYKRLGKQDVKSGDWGRASITLSAYTKGTGGVGCYLSNLQMVREGEALSGATSAEDDFAAFDDDADAFN